MSTRSRVGVLNADWSIRSIYVHYDGYPSHHYPILRDHYSTTAKIKALLLLGDLKALGKEIGIKTNFGNPADRQCIAFMRDGSGIECKSEFSRTPKDFARLCVDCRAEFAYLWSGTEWVTHSIWGFGTPKLLVVQP